MALIRVCAWQHRVPRLLGVSWEWRWRVARSHGICRQHRAEITAATVRRLRVR